MCPSPVPTGDPTVGCGLETAQATVLGIASFANSIEPAAFAWVVWLNASPAVAPLLNIFMFKNCEISESASWLALAYVNISSINIGPLSDVLCTTAIDGGSTSSAAIAL